MVVYLHLGSRLISSWLFFVCLFACLGFFILTMYTCCEAHWVSHITIKVISRSSSDKENDWPRTPTAKRGGESRTKQCWLGSNSGWLSGSASSHSWSYTCFNYCFCSFSATEGELYYNFRDTQWLVVSIRVRVIDAMKECHNNLGTGGYTDRWCTLEKVLSLYHWSTVRDDVNKWVRVLDWYVITSNTLDLMLENVFMYFS